MKSYGQLFKRPAGHAPLCIRAIFLILAAGAVCLSRAADNEEEKPDGSPSSGQKAAKPAAAAGASAGLQSFGQMIPLGSRSRGVRIPSFENGRPSSLIIADAMTRLDDDRLFSEKMTIHVYAEKKEEDMRIDLKTGTYNMGAQILSSTERSRVSRSDFQIEGDSMVYDTKSAQGKMVGNVEMIIFDASSASKKMNIQTGGKPVAGDKKAVDKSPPANPAEKSAK